MSGVGTGLRVGLISDTHGRLRPEVFELFEGVDVILHAGDVGDTAILDELAVLAPVHAVHGNTDGSSVRAVAPAELSLEVGGRKFVLVHGHLFGSLTPATLRDRYPDCDVVVYGHTHKPLVDAAASPLIVNPGAAGPARFKLLPSVAILHTATLSVDPLRIGGE